MLNNLPKEVLIYLINELPPFTGVLIVQTDSEGKIINYHGPHKEYLREMPETGKLIHEYVPALFSMIPPLISPMVLNTIKCDSSIYADIHIVEGDDLGYFIFFVDQNHIVEGIKDVLQKMNEDKLSLESKSITSTSSLPNPTKVFGDIIIEPVNNQTAFIRSDIPGWFEKLSPGLSIDTSFEFTELFPFLEVFMIEAEEFWNQKKDGKFRSGIWTESLPDGTEMALNAYAIMYSESKYILIAPLEENMDNEQLGYQMAREQKLAYEKLEKTEKKLKTLLDYKDKFVSIVSHDLRSPVAAVLGIAELLTNDETELNKLSDFYKSLIYNIKEEMLRMLDYNDKLYHWSNLELGNFEVLKEKESLRKIIETAERTSSSKFTAKNIRFATNLEKDFQIEVDNTLFLQVLNNLVSNAVKFTPEDGTISINVKRLENSTEVIVKDSGVGMPKNVSENIFSGFARNSTLGTKGEKGTGLGLGIVKKIIDAHGFDIRVESEVGHGSSFIISIPN